jgi:hypothetical protein
MARLIEVSPLTIRHARTSGALGLLAGLLAVATAVTAAAQTPAPARPSTIEVMLVRNALTAVNHANISGNYTVLRDLGSTAFRDKNSAAQLATIFQNLRDKKIDLSPTLVLDPQFTQPPGVNQAGQLVLVGYFPTQPLQVNFAVAYQRVDAGWMIYEISLGTTEVRAQPAQPQYVPAQAQYPTTQPQYNAAPATQARVPQQPYQQRPYAR